MMMAGAASSDNTTDIDPIWDFLGETDFPANTVQGSAPLVFVQREECFLSATAGRFPKSGQQFTPLRRLVASAAKFGMSARSIVSPDPISGRSPCSYRNTVPDDVFRAQPGAHCTRLIWRAIALLMDEFYEDEKQTHKRC